MTVCGVQGVLAGGGALQLHNLPINTINSTSHHPPPAPAPGHLDNMTQMSGWSLQSPSIIWSWFLSYKGVLNFYSNCIIFRCQYIDGNNDDDDDQGGQGGDQLDPERGAAPGRGGGEVPDGVPPSACPSSSRHHQVDIMIGFQI